MTTEQINIFVYRLLLNEVTRAELEALSVEDLTAINLHLFRSRRDSKHDTHALTGPVTFGSLAVSEGPKRITACRTQRTYSEAEILAEFGVFS